MSHWDFAMP